MKNASSKLLRSHFDRVFVINLRERADRRREIAAEFATLGETFTQRKIELFPAVRPHDAGGFPSAGIRGCFLSHWGVIARAAALGVQHVLVLEDDVQFTPAMHEHGQRMLDDLLVTSWDIAFLGHGGVDETAVATRGGTQAAEWRPLANRGFGTHCYAVRARCFDALLSYMTQVEERPPGHPDGGKLNADALYTMFCSRYPVTAIQAWPSLATQRASASDISPKWFDRVVGLRAAASLARSILKG